ncbi:MAG: fasciclin domain-containing protein [Phormidesmis sp.]
MRFIAFNKSIRQSTRKFVGFSAALMILPIAVACGANTTTDASESDLTSEVPGEVSGEVSGEIPGEISGDVTTGELDGREAPIGGTGESIVDVAASNGSFNTLTAAVQAAGLEETLDADGPYTVFAPTDAAFAALPVEVVEKLAKPENQAALQEILAYHVLEGAVAAEDIEPGMLSTIKGESLEVGVDAAGVTVNGSANVVQPDVVAGNGVIHVVDTVLLPPTFDAATLL